MKEQIVAKVAKSFCEARRCGQLVIFDTKTRTKFLSLNLPVFTGNPK